MLAQRKVIGDGGNVNVRAKVLLFDYSDDDYDHLDGEDINKEEKRIENFKLIPRKLKTRIKLRNTRRKIVENI